MDIKPVRTKAEYRRARDLEPLMGRRNRSYEALNRKPPMNLKMIWRLHSELGIPVESLIKQGRCNEGGYTTQRSVPLPNLNTERAEDVKGHKRAVSNRGYRPRLLLRV